jgi:CBS domain-containing protein
MEAVMKVRDIMTRDVRVASPSDNLKRAAQIMEEHDFGMLPVGDEGRLVGMLSDRDITIRAVARGVSPDSGKVRDIMSAEVKYVYDDDTVEDAARSMSDLQVRRLPVLDRDKRLVGIVSLGDLAVNEPKPAGDALREISQPAH